MYKLCILTCTCQIDIAGSWFNRLSVDRMSIKCTLAAGEQRKVKHTKIDYKGLFCTGPSIKDIDTLSYFLYQLPPPGCTV